MVATVMLVDDHPVVRTGLRAVIDAHDSVEVVGEAGTGEEALELAAAIHPNVVLCDLRLGVGMDGLATTRALRALPQPPAVLILTTFDRDAEVLGALEAGAAGYLLKDVSPETIVRAIDVAARGELFMPPELSARVMQGLRAPLPKLTDRELEVLRHVALGESNKDISKALFVSEATVKSHLVHVFTKLGVDSRARAVRIGQETGLL